MSFFIRKSSSSRGQGDDNNNFDRKTPKSGASRGRGGASRSRGRGRGFGRKAPARTTRDAKQGKAEEISSDSEMGDDRVENSLPSPAGSDAEDTPHEKRLRLAKKYLKQLRAEAPDITVGHDFISSKLEEDVLEKQGMLQRQICDSLNLTSVTSLRVLKGHRLSPTCCRLSEDGRHVYSASKDSSIVKWDVETGKQLNVIPGLNGQTAHFMHGHRKPIYALALSSDGKFLVSGGGDKGFNIWDGDGLRHVKLLGAKQTDEVLGLTFRQGTSQLFCASANKSVTHFNLNEMGYVETLYGHQDEVLDIDSLAQERCLTAGGKDGTLRLWKIPEESCLVFNGPKVHGSIESCAMINEGHFVSGFEDGSIAVWSRMKKRPCLVTQAHRVGNTQDSWVTSVRSCPNTDLVVSGSHDGLVNFWRCAQDYRQLDKIGQFVTPGFLNDIQISQNGQLICLAIGQEHRLGRWWTVKEARNSVVLLKVPAK